MSSVIIIPARIGSTRLPRKPLADINGKPMIVHVYERCVRANIADVFIATDSLEIKAVIDSVGGKAIMTDPNLPSGTDRIYKALCSIDPLKIYTTVINVQGDVPNIQPSVIQSTLDLMDICPDADITTPVCKIKENTDKIKPNIVKPVLSFIGIDYARAIYFSRSVVPYGEGDIYEHIGLYVYKRSAIERFVTLPQSELEKRESLEQLRAIEDGMKVYAKVVNSKPLSIDTPEDLKKANSTLL